MSDYHIFILVQTTSEEISFHFSSSQILKSLIIPLSRNYLNGFQMIEHVPVEIQGKFSYVVCGNRMFVILIQ